MYVIMIKKFAGGIKMLYKILVFILTVIISFLSMLGIIKKPINPDPSTIISSLDPFETPDLPI